MLNYCQFVNGYPSRSIILSIFVLMILKRVLIVQKDFDMDCQSLREIDK